MITASVLATAASILPLSYLVDYYGKKPALILSIAGTILSLLAMIAFPSRLLFLMLNMILGIFLALTQVSLGSADSRLMSLMERVRYYSLPLAFSIFTNYAVSYLPKWMGAGRGAANHEAELALAGVVVVVLFIFIDSQYNSRTQAKVPKRAYARLNVGGISIPLINEEQAQEEAFDPFDSIAEEVNFLLQGVLNKHQYAGPPVEIEENSVGDLVIRIEGQGEYIGVDQLPEGEVKRLIGLATTIWVDQGMSALDD
jgi:hypothetical protein